MEFSITTTDVDAARKLLAFMKSLPPEPTLETAASREARLAKPRKHPVSKRIARAARKPWAEADVPQPAIKASRFGHKEVPRVPKSGARKAARAGNGKAPTTAKPGSKKALYQAAFKKYGGYTAAAKAMKVSAASVWTAVNR